MKEKDLQGILRNTELDEASKISQILALSGADRNTDKATVEKEWQTKYDALVSQHATEKASWDTEKNKYAESVSKEDHQKVVDELNVFKSKEENGRRHNYLVETHKAKKGYADLVADKLDWSKASYDDGKKTYTGDEFTKQFDALKKQYPDLFEPVGNPAPAPSKGYMPKNNQGEIDLTKL